MTYYALILEGLHPSPLAPQRRQCRHRALRTRCHRLERVTMCRKGCPDRRCYDQMFGKTSFFRGANYLGAVEGRLQAMVSTFALKALCWNVSSEGLWKQRAAAVSRLCSGSFDETWPRDRSLVVSSSGQARSGWFPAVFAGVRTLTN